MALAQQKFREMVFQLLYSFDIGQPDESSMIELIMNELAVSKKNVKLAQDRMHLILARLSEIDPMISSVSTSYDFDRIQTVTRNILRLGVFELFFDPQIPPKVAIAEAMRLARKFGSPESASFVNALLDHLYQASLGKTTEVNRLDQTSKALMHSEEQAQQISLEIEQNPDAQIEE
jgi:transcription antitermination protein NusB